MRTVLWPPACRGHENPVRWKPWGRLGFEVVDATEPGWTEWSDQAGGYVWRRIGSRSFSRAKTAIPVHVRDSLEPRPVLSAISRQSAAHRSRGSLAQTARQAPSALLFVSGLISGRGHREIAGAANCVDAETSSLFVTALLIALFLSIPDQSERVLGIELAALALITEASHLILADNWPHPPGVAAT